MLPHSGRTHASPNQSAAGASLAPAAHKVVVVNGSVQMVELLESILEAGRYDVVFVESNEHAYSQVKRVQPHLVILCMHLDDMEGFQVLSMLKIDEATRGIPVLTYTTDYEGEDREDPNEDSTDGMLAPQPAPRMH
jgi:PleD family two-component response regulator